MVAAREAMTTYNVCALRSGDWWCGAVCMLAQHVAAWLRRYGHLGVFFWQVLFILAEHRQIQRREKKKTKQTYALCE